MVRYLVGGVPEIGTLRCNRRPHQFPPHRQTPGGITMFYDVGQKPRLAAQYRPRTESPHLPAAIRQWYGDLAATGRATPWWSMSPISARDRLSRARVRTLHVVERWTRLGPTTLGYEVTVEDPTVWVRPWTAKQEFSLQSNQENRISTEPRCIEGKLRPSRIIARTPNSKKPRLPRDKASRSANHYHRRRRQ